MRKIILSLFCILLIAGFASAWSANRVIVGNNVTIVIDASSTTGFIITETLPIGATASNIGQSGVYTSSQNKIKWTKADNSVLTLTYSFSGNGIVSGTITGGDPPSQVAIIGDSVLGTSTPIIKINEVESNPVDETKEYVELYNPNGFAVNISGWKIVDSRLRVDSVPQGSIISANGFFVFEETMSTLDFLNNDSIILKDKNDGIIDQTPFLADNANDNNTWQRVPDGTATWVFKNATKGVTNNNQGCTPNWVDGSWGLCTNSWQARAHIDSNNCGTSSGKPSDDVQACTMPGSESDDLMVNYVKGRINIDGDDADSSIRYMISVLDGPNAGYNFTGYVDENIPDSEKDNGLYFSQDNIRFSTGSRFRISVPRYDCSQEDEFENGGNEINLDCSFVVYPPILDFIGNRQVAEGQTLTIQLHATDANEDILAYYTNADFGLLNANTGLFTWTPGYDTTNSSRTFIVTFNVTDGLLWDNETIQITVTNSNIPPVIMPIDDIIIDEDSGFHNNYTLNASDSDGIISRFEVSEEDISKVDCSVSDAKLGVNPARDFSGTAICKIRVYDNQNGYDETIVNIIVNNINDAPVITSFYPENSNIIIDATGSQDFLITWRDTDNTRAQVLVRWLVNGIEKGIGDSFIFAGNGTFATFNITVIVSDLQTAVSKTWILTTSNLPKTCQQQNGFALSDEETCKGILLNASDSGKCCNIKGALSFSNIDTCESINPKVKVTITSPDAGDDFEIGDVINGEIKVKNEFNDEKDFDVFASLYDISEQDDLKNIEESLTIDNGDSESFEFDMNVSNNIEKNSKIYLYVRAEDEDNESNCNEQYIKLDIKRKKHDVAIRNMNAEPINAFCGDTVNIETQVNNIGTSDEDVYILLADKQLGINTRTAYFSIEKYDDKDQLRKTIEAKIPENVSGNYNLDASVFFEDGSSSIKIPVSIECKPKIITISEAGPIVLNGKNYPPSPVASVFNFGDYIRINKQALIFIIDILLFLGILIVICIVIKIKRV
jgi:hypothetical protein